MTDAAHDQAHDPDDSVRLGHGLDSLRPTLHNGPGWRVPLWFQGCTSRCTEVCLTPRLLDPAGGSEIRVTDILDRLRLVCRESGRPVEGITVLGGEPSEQPEALATLLQGARALGLSCMVYTGYTLEQLNRRTDHGTARWLASTDLLVDGPFQQGSYADTARWRGSTNQRIHCLSSRYDQATLDEAWERQRKGFSIRVDPTGAVSISGLQTRDAAKRVETMVAMRLPPATEEQITRGNS